MRTSPDRDKRRYRGAGPICSANRRVRISHGPYDSIRSAVDQLRKVALCDGCAFKPRSLKHSGRDINHYICDAATDDAAPTNTPCTFQAHIRRRKATNEHFITKYVPHSYGCAARAPGVDKPTKEALLHNAHMHTIALQRGATAVSLCIQFMRDNYNYLLDERSAKSLINHIRRHTTYQQKHDVLQAHQLTQERHNKHNELRQFLQRAETLILQMSTTTTLHPIYLRNYHHLLEPFHKYCREHIKFNDIADSWTSLHTTSHETHISHLRQAINIASEVLQTLRDATTRQIEALRNIRYEGDVSSLTEAEALQALRTGSVVSPAA